MERGFIKAEVINFKDFSEIGSLQAARDSGHLRLEGKDYEVRDGDLIRFRFHV
jgi:ribosome-binding ATPase YchF (GTP1/OBG family)